VWVGAYRTRAASPALSRTVAELDAVRFVLDPLDPAAVAEIAGDVLGTAPTPAQLRTAERAAGNPFLLVELLGAGHGEELPLGLRDRIRERLAALSPVARQTAHAAAALGHSLTFDHLAGMLGQSSVTLLEPVGELLRAELLADDGTRLHYPHDLVREAVAESVPATARNALARQAAEVLLASGATPLEVATRLSASAHPGDRAAARTLGAAVQALAPADPLGASELARTALALTPPGDSDRPQLVATTAVLLHAAGRDEQARDFAAAELGPALPPEAEAAVRLGIAQMYSLPADFRIGASRVALTLPGVSEPMRARHLAILVLSLAAAAQIPAAQRAAAEAEPAVRACGDAQAAISLEFGRLAIAEATFDYPAMTQQITAISRLAGGSEQNTEVQASQWFRSSLLSHLDRFDEAAQVVRHGQAIAVRDQQAWIAPRWDIWQGWLLLQQGRLTDAVAALDGAFSAEGLDVALALPDATGLAALGIAGIHTGDRRIARKCAQIARATLAAGAYDDGRRQVTWLLARQALARGDAAGARTELRAAGREDSLDVLPRLSRDVTTEPHLVRLALAAGDRGLADAAVAEAEERARRNPGVAPIDASAAHARGLRDHDPAPVEAAVGLLTGGPRPLALASAVEDLGRLRTGTAAVAAYEQAAGLYAAAGATWDAERVERRLRALGVRRRTDVRHGWESLTNAELVVARSVADGRTNRETAERLGVSPHTVNTHLRNVFAKLGVHSRVELVRVVVGHD
jgi:DNA-binding CsgD family transcriptional regulator